MNPTQITFPTYELEAHTNVIMTRLTSTYRNIVVTQRMVSSDCHRDLATDRPLRHQPRPRIDYQPKHFSSLR